MMSVWPKFIDPDHLAPGDSKPHPALPKGIELHVVESPEDPRFELALETLEDEFGKSGEVESREVLADRLRLRPDRPVNGYGMRYRIVLLSVDGKLTALRDHTAIVSDGEVTVHLSHVLVLKPWRRRGLATLMRTLPVTGARRAAEQAGIPDAPITLVCEMESVDAKQPATVIRRLSYEKAGFLSIPPGHGYMQPDFRTAEEIAADPDGSWPLPFDLIFRRVGREDEPRMSGRELLAHIERLYAMYQAGFEDDHMEPCHRWLEHFRAHCPETLALVPPTKIL